MGNESQNIVSSNSCPPQTTIRVPDFTVNEFARLCVLLRDDDQCRSAVHNATGLELSRRFNNPSVITVEDFRGVVDGIDSNSCPLAHRSASLLKNHYRESRRDFTDYYDK
ncbi:hypothetical protein FGB62_231g015 [Gracilaria domingensis]|nr:hypothetical protein FGB62_231g015 [Gracilaria domingensis]